MEVPLIDPIIFPEWSFRLVPEVLSAIYMIIFTASKLFRAINSEVFKIAQI